MWKKILYYVTMIVVGILLMIVTFVSLVGDRYKKLVNKSINSGDYSNVLSIYTTYANNHPLAGNMELSNDKGSAFVFETASQRDTPDGEKTRDYLDIEYTVVLVGNYRANSNSQSEGKIYNKSGFTITNSNNETFTYYDNKYADGIITNEEDRLFGAYNLKMDSASNLKIFTYAIPLEFLKNYTNFTKYDITKIEVSDSAGKTYMTFTPNNTLSYNSETHTKISELIPYFNAAVKSNSKDKELNTFYKTWKPEFLSIDGSLMAIKNNVIFNGAFWFKVVGTGVLYILFVFILGDFTIGRRRILYLIQGGNRKANEGSFSKPNPNNKTMNAKVTKVTEVKEENVGETDDKD